VLSLIYSLRYFGLVCFRTHALYVVIWLNSFTCVIRIVLYSLSLCHITRVVILGRMFHSSTPLIVQTIRGRVFCVKGELALCLVKVL
jgi:hypothetical protein